MACVPAHGEQKSGFTQGAAHTYHQQQRCGAINNARTCKSMCMALHRSSCQVIHSCARSGSIGWTKTHLDVLHSLCCSLRPYQAPWRACIRGSQLHH